MSTLYVSRKIGKKARHLRSPERNGVVAIPTNVVEAKDVSEHGVRSQGRHNPTQKKEFLLERYSVATLAASSKFAFMVRRRDRGCQCQ